MAKIPLALHTLYADLVQQVHAAPQIAGTVYRQTVKGFDYLYVRSTVGEVRRDRFLGRADDPEVQAKAAAARQGTANASERRKIVRILRGQGVPAPSPDLGRVLDAIADAGLFRDAVLVGTAAYQCYSPVLGIMLPAASVMTQDADIATASLAITADDAAETFETIVRRADRTFSAIPGLDRRAPPSRFRSGSGFIVDILTPQLRRSDQNPMPLPRLAAGAIPMQQLGWLIEEPVEAVALHGAGVPVRIPAPARYGVHKLIVAQKRGAQAVKRLKDLQQAKALMEALGEADPFSWSDMISDACGRGKTGWRAPIEKSLRELGVDCDGSEP